MGWDLDNWTTITHVATISKQKKCVLADWLSDTAPAVGSEFLLLTSSASRFPCVDNSHSWRASQRNENQYTSHKKKQLINQNTISHSVLQSNYLLFDRFIIDSMISRWHREAAAEATRASAFILSAVSIDCKSCQQNSCSTRGSMWKIAFLASTIQAWILGLGQVLMLFSTASCWRK